MTDAVIVGDIHLSDRAPTSRRDSYAEEILAKVAWCSIFANHPGPGQGALPLVLAGDVFHLKVPHRTSYRLVQRLHSILATVARGVWIVPGNHDLTNGRLDSLAAQPLGALCRMGNVHELDGHDSALPQINGIPWHEAFDGGDWRSAVEAYIAQWQDDNCVPDLVVTHAPIFPVGKEPGVYPTIPASEWGGVMRDAGISATYYGHIHEQHGSFVAGGHLFCNQGALSRGSIHEESVNRHPAITDWNGSKCEFYDVPLPAEVVKPPSEVFLFEKAEEKKQAESIVAAFQSALGEVQLPVLTVEEVVSYIRKEGTSAAVVRVVEDALEKVM